MIVGLAEIAMVAAMEKTAVEAMKEKPSPLPIQVCYGEDCLFGMNEDAPYGVRELMYSADGTKYWHHHAWGISRIEDADQIVRRIVNQHVNSDHSQLSYFIQQKYAEDLQRKMMEIMEVPPSFLRDEYPFI